MNYRKILLVLLAAAMLVLSGCGGDSAPPEDEMDMPVSDVPETGLSIRRAQNFHIAYLGDDVKLLTDSAGRELLLVPEGKEAPSGYENAIQITTPIKRAMFVSAAHVGFLGALEEESLYDSIAAVTTEISQWNNPPQIADRFSSGQISYIEQNAWVEGDVEGIAAAAPDLVFADISPDGHATLCTKLDELGIPYTVAAENRDTGAEAYLEWLKFFGAFYNLDQKASDLYDEKMDYLDELYQKASSIPESERPVVAFGVVDSGIVYTQGGYSMIAQQLERAGAEYALKDLGGGMVRLGMEEFLEKCKDADILIYDAMPMYMQGTLLDEDPWFAEFQAYQNQRVYTKDNSYYMNIVKIVEEFEDLLAICHPELEENHVFTIYQPLQNY